MTKRRPFNAVLAELAASDLHREALLKPDGTVNGSALARELKFSQPTIARALKNPRYQPKKDLVDAVAAYFQISVSQARGEESLRPAPISDDRLSPRARNLAKRYEKLLPQQKELIDLTVGQFETIARQQAAG